MSFFSEMLWGYKHKMRGLNYLGFNDLFLFGSLLSANMELDTILLDNKIPYQSQN